MHITIRKRFLGYQLALVAVSALLLGRGTSTILGARIDPGAKSTGSENPTFARVEPAALVDASFTLVEATERNIFGAIRDDRFAGDLPQADSPLRAAARGALRPTTLPLRLVGTTVYEPAVWSLAQIEEVGTGNVGLYSLSRCTTAQDPLSRPAPCSRLLGIATLTTIERDRVVFFNTQSERMEFLDFTHDGTFRAPPQPDRAPVKKERALLALDGIRKVGENAYVVARATVDGAIANMEELLGPLRAVPSFRDGQVEGFKIFGVRPESLLAKLGLQNGDVIARVNGYSLDDPGRALDLYSKLRESRQLTVDVRRRGQPQTMEYTVGS